MLIPVLAGGLMFTACKDKATTKEENNASNAAEATQPKPGDPEPATPLKATATAEQRAAKLGFAKHLPKDLQYYSVILDGKSAYEKFMKTKVGEFIIKRMADEGVDLADMAEDEEFRHVLSTYGEEYFNAYGNGTTPAVEEVFTLLERLTFYGLKFGTYMADGAVREGSSFEPKSPQEVINGPLKGASKDLIRFMSKFDMPPIYQGSKVSNESAREFVASQMDEMVSNFGSMDDIVEEVTIKRGDAEFSGYKIMGAKIVEMAGEDMSENLKEFFETQDIEDFKNAVAKRNVVVLTGVIGDYVVFFMGKSEDDFVIVDNVSDSICASDKLVYLDSYLDKDILSAGFADGDYMENISVNSLLYRFIGAGAMGIKSGLGDATSLGDMQDVEVLLESLDEQGKKLVSMLKAHDAGTVVYIEDGLKAEVYGGSNQPSFDLDHTHTLGALGQGEGTIMFANWTNNQDYNAKVMDYFDTLGETSYVVAKRIAGLDIEDGDMEEFRQGLGLFDEKFKADALALWKGLSRDMEGGFSGESAFVVDINGTMPEIPNVPEAVAKNGKFPRISFVARVKDREKLAQSWNSISGSLDNMLKTIGEMQSKDIKMPKPMSSDKDGLKTWFIPIPYQSDDFVPCVSVSDEIFFASTSKSFSEGLADKFKEGSTSGAKKGAVMHVDFKQLNAYAKQWLDLVEKNADEIIPDENKRADFMENKQMIHEVLDAFSTLEKMDVHTRREGGRTRISGHIKGS